MYRRILVAADGSHASRLATLQAIEMAKACDAEVKVIYVVDDSEALLGVAFIDRESLLRNIMAYGQEVLDGWSKLLGATGVRHSVALLDKPISKGRIAETILAQADQWDADLIVLGTHGRRGFLRVVMGSVAQGVVHQSSRPVLLVRSPAEY
ncbi:universal stress protein [Cupriavidus sp. WKF15]|uniref:universal stress protein n=1 Tax=Cupriavidus sp. WKF15 TaxID=3032282 RepID=UPI0023E0BCD8|nr:universal stress protein [Cupriavidus sp. WKF15]WER44701.1 universal stress protein [Cupriavidus sp. WKF15]